MTVLPFLRSVMVRLKGTLGSRGFECTARVHSRRLVFSHRPSHLRSFSTEQHFNVSAQSASDSHSDAVLSVQLSLLTSPSDISWYSYGRDDWDELEGHTPDFCSFRRDRRSHDSKHIGCRFFEEKVDSIKHVNLYDLFCCIIFAFSITYGYIYVLILKTSVLNYFELYILTLILIIINCYLKIDRCENKQILII